MQMAIHRLNHKISFGTVESAENDMTGDYDTEFVPDVTVHCAMYQRNETQKVQIVGTDLADTIVVVIRSRKLNKKLKAQLSNDETVYAITDISSDASGLPVGYDLITLKDETKVS